MAKAAKKVKKRVVQITPDGLAYIHASFNNIIVSLTNKQGQVICRIELYMCVTSALPIIRIRQQRNDRSCD